MHIISKFKDFYDYLQYSYGQDDNVYWYRDYLFPGKPDLNTIKLSDITNKKFRITYTSFLRKSSDDVYHRLGLYVLGDIYPVIVYKKNNKRITSHLTYELFDRFKDELDDKLEYMIHPKETLYKRYIKLIGSLIQYSEPLLNIVSEKTKQPIFLFDHNCRHIEIYNKIPNLSTIKNMAGIIDPIDLYKNLYNFHLNMYNDKNNNRPVDVDNTSKIYKAGFDTVNSFRNTKNRSK